MKRKHEDLFLIQNSIHDFFKSRDFLHVLTPPIVENPGMETHIHPFQIHSAFKKETLPLYLHTSPEFHMKSLLSEGYEKIFTMSYAFRDEPDSETHRKQFIMLEWYRANSRYEVIMDDTIELINFCARENSFPERSIKKISVNNLFKEILGFEILDYLDLISLKKKLQETFIDIHIDENNDYSWDDLYFLIFLNKIEPKLKEYGDILLYEFPYHLAALSTISEKDHRVCERFEVYLDGIEICNCFNELTHLETQKERFKLQAQEKQRIYNYSLTTPNTLYHAIDKGIHSPAGIALGVERLLMSLSRKSECFFD